MDTIIGKYANRLPPSEVVRQMERDADEMRELRDTDPAGWASYVHEGRAPEVDSLEP